MNKRIKAFAATELGRLFYQYDNANSKLIEYEQRENYSYKRLAELDSAQKIAYTNFLNKLMEFTEKLG